VVDGAKGVTETGGNDRRVGAVGVEDGGAPKVAGAGPGTVVADAPDGLVTAPPAVSVPVESTDVIGAEPSAMRDEVDDEAANEDPTSLPSELVVPPPRVVLQTTIAIPSTKMTTETGPNHFLDIGTRYQTRVSAKSPRHG